MADNFGASRGWLRARLERGPLVMGILNVTPDSFSDGGKFLDADKAVAEGKKMIADGVDIIDVGGESTGPGSKDVSLAEEIGRIIPVIEKLAPFAHTAGANGECAKISIDTWKAEVARLAIRAGADMVNDVTALRGDSEMARVVAAGGALACGSTTTAGGIPIVLMYSKDASPRTTKEIRNYDDVIAHIKKFLAERIKVAKQAGILEENIVIDPGMGMFVSAEPRYSHEILERLGELKALGYPILVGPSKKSFLGGALNERGESSLNAAKTALQNGASIIRMHDVVDAVRMRNNMRGL